MQATVDASRLAADLSGSQSRRGNGDVRFTKIEFLSPDAIPLQFVRSGDALILRLHYHAVKHITRPDFEIGIYTDFGTLITKFSTWIDYQISLDMSGRGTY